MKEKTKNVITIVVKVILSVLKLLRKNKTLAIMALCICMMTVGACVNGQMIVIKSPVDNITMHLDSTGTIDISVAKDTTIVGK